MRRLKIAIFDGFGFLRKSYSTCLRGVAKQFKKNVWVLIQFITSLYDNKIYYLFLTSLCFFLLVLSNCCHLLQRWKLELVREPLWVAFPTPILVLQITPYYYSENRYKLIRLANLSEFAKVMFPWTTLMFLRYNKEYEDSSWGLI